MIRPNILLRVTMTATGAIGLACPAASQMSVPARRLPSTAAQPIGQIQQGAALEALARLPARVIDFQFRAMPLSGDALAAANEQVRVEASQAMLGPAPVVPPQGRSFGSRRLATPMPAIGVECVAARRIGVPKGNVTPGGLISVRGCDLGSGRGMLKMLGAFPGGAVALEIVEWTPQLVLAKIPDDIRGATDQDVRIQFMGADRAVGNDQPACFQARRETVELPETLVANINCAKPQFAACSYQSLLGQRWASGWHSGTDSQWGRDLWRLTIGSAWELARIESRLNNAEAVALPHEGTQQNITVDWTSRGDGDVDYYQASYAMRFFVIGPVGVAFTAASE